MSVQKQDIPQLVHETLVDDHDEPQEQRIKGYVRTQSIRELFKYLDADDVLHLEAQRLVKDKTESFGRLSLPSVREYTDMEEQLKRKFVIDYDRVEHGTFNWPEVRDFIEEESLRDVAVTRLVYRFESNDLHERLLTLLQETIDYPGSTFFNQPFVAELWARKPGHSHARQEVRDYNDETVFTHLGWNVRTMDLEAIWSTDAWKDEGKDVYTEKAEEVTRTLDQRDIEELVFNHVSSEGSRYGAVNSYLVYNTWKHTLSPGVVGHKEFEWTDDQHWEQTR